MYTVPGPVRARPRAVLAVIGAGAVATAWLWWNGTPAVSGFGDWLTNAGRITGLLAGYGVAVLIGLMARIPPVERGVGADQLARWHSMGGRYVVSLVVAHALLITWGYAVTAHAAVACQAWTLLDSYPDVLIATAAGLLLVMTGIVSARAIRSRLRYETWYYLHFYTYLAAALAFSHQFAVGAEFIMNTAARVAWSALYIGVAAAITWYRFITPARQAVRHRFTVESVAPEAPDVVSIVIGGRHLDELQAQPGQFFRWRFLARGLWWTSMPYSLSAPPRGDLMRITVKAAGDHSAALRGLAPGHARRRRGPVRRAHRGAAPPPQGAADRGRGGHHPVAPAARDAARRAGRPHADLPGQQHARRGVPARARAARRSAARRRSGSSLAPGTSSTSTR